MRIYVPRRGPNEPIRAAPALSSSHLTCLRSSAATKASSMSKIRDAGRSFLIGLLFHRCRSRRQELAERHIQRISRTETLKVDVHSTAALFQTLGEQRQLLEISIAQR